MLSNRYISDRFLPDKAIDLVDEAAASLRMQIDSLPVEIDEIERRIMQLEIERQALLKETDKHSKERRAQIDKELAKLKEDSSGRKARWQAEKHVAQHSAQREIGRVEFLDGHDFAGHAGALARAGRRNKLAQPRLADRRPVARVARAPAGQAVARADQLHPVALVGIVAGAEIDPVDAGRGR